MFAPLLKQHKQTVSSETETITSDEDEKAKTDKAASTDDITNTINDNDNGELISVNFQAAFT